MRFTYIVLLVICVCFLGSCTAFKPTTFCNYDSKSNSSIIYQFAADKSVSLFIKSEGTNRLIAKGRWNVVRNKTICYLDEKYNFKLEKISRAIDTFYVKRIFLSRKHIVIKSKSSGFLIKNKLVICE